MHSSTGLDQLDCLDQLKLLDQLDQAGLSEPTGPADRLDWLCTVEEEGYREIGGKGSDKLCSCS